MELLQNENQKEEQGRSYSQWFYFVWGCTTGIFATGVLGILQIFNPSFINMIWVGVALSIMTYIGRK